MPRSLAEDRQTKQGLQLVASRQRRDGVPCRRVAGQHWPAVEPGDYGEPVIPIMGRAPGSAPALAITGGPVHKGSEHDQLTIAATHASAQLRLTGPAASDELMAPAPAPLQLTAPPPPLRLEASGAAAAMVPRSRCTPPVSVSCQSPPGTDLLVAAADQVNRIGLLCTRLCAPQRLMHQKMQLRRRFSLADEDCKDLALAAPELERIARLEEHAHETGATLAAVCCRSAFA